MAKTSGNGNPKADFTLPMTGLPASLEVTTLFPEYENLNAQSLAINGQKIPRQLVFKGLGKEAKYIADVSDDFKLVPNQMVLEKANEVAKEVGAVPWTSFEGPWFIKPNSHILENDKQTRIHALYAWNDPVEITKDDKIHLGFSVHNGIDGGLGLGIGYFTFRHACQNMFMMGLHGKGQQADDRNVQAHIYRKHVKSLDISDLKGMIQNVIKNGENAIAAIRAMNETLLTQAKAEKIVELKVVPKGYIEVKMPYLELPATDVGKVKLVNDKVTEYRVWNDVTAFITHNDDLSLDSRMVRFGRLQKALDIAPMVKRV